MDNISKKDDKFQYIDCVEQLYDKLNDFLDDCDEAKEYQERHKNDPR